MHDPLFTTDGERFLPSELTRGPWDPEAQHAGPPAALIGRAIERCPGIDGGHVGRVTVEILRPVPLEPLEVKARVVRPGRNVELIEATLTGPEGELMRARAWRLRTAETTFEPGPEPDPPPPGPDQGRTVPFFATGQEVGYHTAIEGRFVEGEFTEPGPAVAWVRLPRPLVDDEQPSPLQRVLVAADSGNGVSAPFDYRRYLFINTDLTVHLHRMPAGEWVCLDAITRPEPHGVGMTDTLLWDEQGRIGRAAQTLLVRNR